MMYYCFEKSTGLFAGSGTGLIDTKSHGSTETAPPRVADGLNLIWSGSKWNVASGRPGVVTPRQLRLALLAAGITRKTIDDMLVGNEAAIIEWEYATEIDKSHPLLLSMAAGVGLDAKSIDAIFEQARLI